MGVSAKGCCNKIYHHVGTDFASGMGNCNFQVFGVIHNRIWQNPYQFDFVEGGRMPRGTMGQKSSIMIVPKTYDPLAALILFAKSSFGKNTVVFAMIPVL